MQEQIKRFEKNFVKGKGCWEWTANKTKRGYGNYRFEGRTHGAHRISYLLYVGNIPKGMCVCHRCDNPSCVRPSHLFIGTQLDNIKDCMNKGRKAQLIGEEHPLAKLTENQIIEIRSMWSQGYRNKDIAQKFGITPTHAASIIYGRLWKNVDNYNKMGSENVNQISYPMLNKMVKERGIKRVTISKAIGITEQTLRNKLQGKSKFKSDEMLMIQERFFPDKDINELFRPAV